MRSSSSSLAVVLVIVVALWATVLVAAPYAVTHQPAATAAFVAATTAYLAGSVICHQLPARSFHLWGTQLPVCARCTGLYAAAPVGALVALLPAAGWGRPRRRAGDRLRQARAVLFVAALATVITVAGEVAGFAQPSDLARAVAAAPLGFIVAWVVGLTARGALD